MSKQVSKQVTKRILQTIQVLIITDGGWKDLVTDYSRFFRHRDITAYFVQLGFKVIELDGANANRVQFTGALAATEPTRYVGHCGHGNERVTTGYSAEPLLDPSNYQDTQGRVCVWNSCTFGTSVDDRLGLGELAEISYNNLLWIEADGAQNPETDQSAPPYFRCMHEPELRIAEDKTFEDACYAQVARYQAEIDQAPPIRKFYLTANLGALVQKPKLQDLWKWHISGNGQQPKKLVLYDNDTEKASWDYSGPSVYLGSIMLDNVGAHKLKAVRPDGKFATVDIEITEDGEDIGFDTPKQGDKFKKGEPIAIKVRI